MRSMMGRPDGHVVIRVPNPDWLQSFFLLGFRLNIFGVFFSWMLSAFFTEPAFNLTGEPPDPTQKSIILAQRVNREGRIHCNWLNRSVLIIWTPPNPHNTLIALAVLQAIE